MGLNICSESLQKNPLRPRHLGSRCRYLRCLFKTSQDSFGRLQLHQWVGGVSIHSLDVRIVRRSTNLHAILLFSNRKFGVLCYSNFLTNSRWCLSLNSAMYGLVCKLFSAAVVTHLKLLHSGRPPPRQLQPRQQPRPLCTTRRLSSTTDRSGRAALAQTADPTPGRGRRARRPPVSSRPRPRGVDRCTPSAATAMRSRDFARSAAGIASHRQAWTAPSASWIWRCATLWMHQPS